MLFTPPPLPLPIVSWLIEDGIGLIMLALFIRAVASWFRIDERNVFIRFLMRITDPFIEPLRRLIPPVGLLDMAFLATFFLLLTLRTLLLQAVPPGW